jgi:hypothetical protein
MSTLTPKKQYLQAESDIEGNPSWVSIVLEYCRRQDAMIVGLTGYSQAASLESNQNGSKDAEKEPASLRPVAIADTTNLPWSQAANGKLSRPTQAHETESLST